MASFKILLSGGGYPLWVLTLLTLAYFMNQLDRYTLTITAKEMEKSLHFGNGKGTGLEYQILAGPAFTLVYTIAGLPVGWISDRASRKYIFIVSLIVWSACTAAMGAANNYWQVLLARAGQGIGQAGCNPVSNSIISELFVPEARGTALGVYNVGIYSGYAMAFGLAGPIVSHWGWRWVYYVFGAAGIPIALALLTTTSEPERGVHDKKEGLAAAGTAASAGAPKPSVLEVARYFLVRPSLVLLCLAGAIRNGAGTVWALNTANFFEQVHGLDKDQVAAWMGWIPLVGGSFGVIFGGFIADKVLKERGPSARIWVLVISQLVAAPFTAGALLLPIPYAFLSLLPANIVGECWVGVLLAVISSLLPAPMRGLGVAIYFFVISNIAGLCPLAVPFLTHKLSFRAALLILYTSLYVLSALVFFLTLTSLARDVRKAKALEDQADESAPLLNGPIPRDSVQRDSVPRDSVQQSE